MHDDNVIAVIRHSGEWAYYAAPVETWVMDCAAWERSFRDAGFSLPPTDPGWRGGVSLLNEESAGRALVGLRECIVSEESLRDALRARLPIRNWDEVMHLFPVVFIDFASQRLWSVYSERLELERYVPAGWTGVFEDFYEIIPFEHRYWIDGEVDYFRSAGGE